ncbi:MAG: hypothetical protein WAM14_15720 [Candidatus Nitrosopolaris sp.]
MPIKKNATLLTSSGYRTNNAWPASFICTSQAPGIFPAIIKELAGGTLLMISSYDQSRIGYFCKLLANATPVGCHQVL